MSIAYACAVSHAPGIVAWADRAPIDQRNALYGGFDKLRSEIAAAKLDQIILFTSEHWANFFLDHISAFCIGRGAHFKGPIEPWLKIQGARIPGAPDLANEILEQCYANGIEPGFTDELAFDHGTMIPLHLLTPDLSTPVVPIVFNTLASPQPSAARSAALGRIVGDVARQSNLRIGLIATGGMSHDPGEQRHGYIDEEFDQAFLRQMAQGQLDQLTAYSTTQFLAAGAGAVELLGWIALAGALRKFSGKVVAYEPVRQWATGIGLMSLFEAA